MSCALKEVMTDELVCHFTWNKTKDTEKLGDTEVSNIFHKATEKCPLFRGPENKEVFKNAMLDALKSTKQRYCNKLKPQTNGLPTVESLRQALQKVSDVIQQSNKSQTDEDDCGTDCEDEDL